MLVPHGGADGYAYCYRHSDPDCNGDGNCHRYRNADCNEDRNSDPNGDEHALMAGSFPQAGPSFSDLSQQDQQDTPGSAPAPTGGVSINDASMAAIMTSPAQQARVAVQMSKQRLQRLAMQLKQARNVL